ncbi:MAG TPA: phytanoyl-CoA dioxygenase family protein [Candidatus Dormibacteraeota bacterium]|jgi:ectoine hydroxylase-related dioxygenase (phytanoyl-CoA dioxygenase family)|nr:phytanoyl-CoA dioxygenase family protein [Candidatus Dormibacteraeota bacterium]
MTPDEILSHPPLVLPQAQRESYFERGCLLVEHAIPEATVARLRAATEEMVERSRALTRSDAVFDLEPGHSAGGPRLRRLTSPVDHHPAYWELASTAPLVDLVADLVGPDVVFHHSKLNFKWAAGGEEVKWHQDISYWPHTNYSPLTVGLYLYDCGPDQGPLGVLPGSHLGELHSQYNGNGEWVGCLAADDVARLPLDTVDHLTGPAGSVTIHNCRVVHGSRPNLSDLGRPLLLNVFASADALPYTANPLPSRYAGTVVRGSRARWAHHDPRPCQVPPDWSGGYTSLFALQQEESWEDDQFSRGRPRTGCSDGSRR